MTIWALSGSAVGKIAAAVGGYFLLHGALNSPDTWVAGFSAYTPSHARVLGYGASLKTAEKESLKHNGVMLDIEKWPYTPVSEQQNPEKTYAKLYRTLQYEPSGHWIVAAPAFNIVKSVEPNFTGAVYPEFIRLHLASKIAPYAGAYIIQAQGAERNPAEYAHLVKAVVHQIQLASPSTVILAGLSMNPPGKPISESVLMQDVQGVHAYVSGFWLSVPSPGKACPKCGVADPEKAVQLITDNTMTYG